MYSVSKDQILMHYRISLSSSLFLLLLLLLLLMLLIKDPVLSTVMVRGWKNRDSYGISIAGYCFLTSFLTSSAKAAK